jgi:lysophospholipase L1-like esterase
MPPKLIDIKKIIFSLLPIILILLGVEMGFRFFPHKDSNPTLAGFVEPDHDLIWRLRRRTKGPVATNELGFRDTAYNADAGVKILLLGDSVAWGNGIPDTKKCFPYLLEKRLNASGKPETFEVINSAVPGYSTFQELKYLKLFGLKLKPHMVILQFSLSDVFERYLVLAEHGGDNIFLGIDTRKAVRGVYGFFLHHSRAFEALVRWLQSRSRRRAEYQVVKMARDHLSRELTEAWEVTLGEIEQIRVICRKQNIPLLLVVPPYRFQLKDPANLRQPQDRLIRYAHAKRVPLIDLLPPFVSIGTRTSIPLFHDASHFTEFGHKVAAKVLVKTIRYTAPFFFKKNTTP